MDQNLEREIQQSFQDGVARLCARSTWAQIDQLRETRSTKRRLRGQERFVKGVSQSQLAESIERTQGTISRWLNEGSLSWTNLIMVLTDLAIEFSDFQQPLPSRDERVIEGRKNAMRRARELMEKVTDVPLPSDEELHCLALVNSSQTWRRAELTRSAKLRRQRLEAAATEVAEIADERLQTTVSLRTVDQLQELRKRWGKAWMWCQCIRVKWSIK